MQSKSALGFSLIELLISLSIVMVLSTLAIVSFQTSGQNARNTKRQADIAQVRASLELYRSAYGTYPIYGTGSRSSNFINMVADSNFAAYLADKNVKDPIAATPYNYRYDSDTGSVYELCYVSEPDQLEVCVANP